MIAHTPATSIPAHALVHAHLSTLLTALWFEIDHGDGSGASGFFTGDAELTFSRRTFRGTDEIDGVYRARAARGPRVSRHLMSNVHVQRHEPDLVEAVSALVLYAHDGKADTDHHPRAGRRRIRSLCPGQRAGRADPVAHRLSADRELLPDAGRRPCRPH